MVPGLYFIFGYYRTHVGVPLQIEDRLGLLLGSRMLPINRSEKLYPGITFREILVPLVQSSTAELSLATALLFAKNYDGTIHLLTVDGEDKKAKDSEIKITPRYSKESYLDDLISSFQDDDSRINGAVVRGIPSEEIVKRPARGDLGLIVKTTHGRTRLNRLLISSVTTNVIHETIPPILVIRPTDEWRSSRFNYRNLLMPLDGSEIAEQDIPYVQEIAYKFNSAVTLVSSAEASESDEFQSTAQLYLDQISLMLTEKGLVVNTRVRWGAGSNHTFIDRGDKN